MTEPVEPRPSPPEANAPEPSARPAPVIIRIRAVPAAHGWRWIAASVVIFRRQPLQWVMMLTVIFLASRVLMVLPLMLALAASLLTPHLAVGVAHAAQAVAAGRPLRPAYLLSGLLKSFLPLLVLGLFGLAAQYLIALGMQAVGGDALTAFMQAQSTGNQAAAEAAEPGALRGLLAGLLLMVPFTMLMWFSPLLVFFEDVPAPVALGISFSACLRNLKPLIVYVCALMLPLFLLAPLSAASGQLDFALWVLAPAIAPTLYTSYRDIVLRG